MVHDTGHPIMYHLDAMVQAPEYLTGSREGIWWLPTKATRDYLILTNQASHPLQGTLWLYDAGGRPWSQSIQLEPRQTQRLSVRQLVNTAGFSGQYGGIKVEIPNGAGSLDTVHILYDEIAGFSATMNMFDYDPSTKLEARDYAEKGRWTTRAPMLALSNPDPVLAFPANTILQPMVLLRNTTRKSVKVDVSFHWRNAVRDGRASIPQLTLAPFESRKIDVQDLQLKGTLPLDAYWAQVSVTTDTLPDEVTAVAASYDATLRYGAQTPFSDQLSMHLEGGQWQVDANHTSLIAAGNGGNKPVKAALTFFYDQGRKQYRLERTIAPDDQWWVDIGQLIQNQTPDKNGSTMPAGLTSGAYQLREISEPQQVLLYEGKVITDKTFGHATYGCMMCCGFGGDAGAPYLVEDPTGVGVAETTGVNVYAANACTGGPQAITNYFPAWVSGSPSILTAQPYSVTGVSIGSTSITANATKMPTGQGQETRKVCPQGPGLGRGTGNVYGVSIPTADIVADQIVVTLSGPASAIGTLTVNLVGPSTTTLQTVPNSVPGSQTFHFNRNSLAVGDYTAVTANWAPNGTFGASKAVGFYSLGVVHHTQYNSPYERECSGAQSPAYITQSSCSNQQTTLKSDFMSQVDLNGSGFAISWGGLQVEAYCLSHGPTPFPPSGSTFRDSGPAGTCNANSGTLNNSTVAIGRDSILQCNDSILIVDGSNNNLATKTVTDTCPVCSGAHIDDYSTAQACSSNAVGDLGTYMTIRLH